MAQQPQQKQSIDSSPTPNKQLEETPKTSPPEATVYEYSTSSDEFDEGKTEYTTSSSSSSSKSKIDPTLQETLKGEPSNMIQLLKEILVQLKQINAKINKIENNCKMIKQ